jgi:valyl-tRNA synthetase
VVEPNLSKQWFVNVKPLAEVAVRAVQDGTTRIIPGTWEKTYYEWMDNIRDWCVSRQIWWGHRIPAWYCDGCGREIVVEETPAACPACGSGNLRQEEDVLDTWFSSALWPFSTLGWPDSTPLLKAYFPTSVLVTGFDILFFWVARMMMMGLHFMKDVPFHDVYIHALVRDEEGKKMSKSTGNVIDPIQVIDVYGADALRFTLAAFAAQGRDIKLSESRIEGYRHFINKLWNAARFSLMHIDNTCAHKPLDNPGLADRWILSRLAAVRGEVTDALDHYRFNDAAGALYRFVWHEFCDWYLEAAKPDLYGKESDIRREASRRVLWRVLRDMLVMLHPFIPFVTEEIWHILPGTAGSIMTAAFPPAGEEKNGLCQDPGAESDMELVMDVITGIRNVRGEMNISPGKNLAVSAHVDNQAVSQRIAANRDMIVNLARLESLTIQPTAEKPKFAATSVVRGITVYVLLEGVIDIDKEKARIGKEMAKIGKEIESAARKLNNHDFLKKAPEEVIERARENNRELQEKKDKLQATLDKLSELAP